MKKMFFGLALLEKGEDSQTVFDKEISKQSNLQFEGNWKGGGAKDLPIKIEDGENSFQI